MIKQKSMLEVEIAGKMFQLLCDNDSPLGNLHDALMQMKGYCVDRMVAAQKQEEEVAKQVMENSKDCDAE